MARPIYIWLPSLTLCALSACSGSENGFFSDVVTGGAPGSGHAGASSQAGSSSNLATAGNANSAGSPGSAGTPSSAGQDDLGSGNGGAQTGGTSSGGRGGARSSGGAGGSRVSTGGSGVAGGHAGAPSASAGSGGTDQDLSCSELLKLASEQLEAARTCSMTASSQQCTGTVSNPCNCEVPVQRSMSAETKAYLETLKQLKDKDCAQVCPKIACTEVDEAQCQSSGSSSKGTCVVSHSLLP